VLVWIAVILLASTEVGAAESSRSLLAPLFRWFKPDITAQEIFFWNIVARKMAHFLEFALLAILVWRTQDFLTDPWNPARYRTVALRTLAIAALIAAFSEFVQFFTNTRSASVADVLRNIGGAALGVGCVLAWKTLRRPGRPVGP
jgi:VanZ family protein